MDHETKLILEYKQLYELRKWVLDNQSMFHSEVRKTAIDVVEENLLNCYKSVEFYLIRLDNP
jgi:hypothetical protein